MLELVINSSIPDALEYYQNITDGAGEWIGELYLDSLFDRESGEFVGLNQGYAFNLDDGTFVSSDIIMFKEGPQINYIGNAIISASGDYKQYTGGSISADVIQYDPTYVAIVTLSEPSPKVEEESSGHGDDSLKLHITNNGGSYTPITSDGMQIGQVFQYIITNPDNSSDIIGDIKGNSFIFPQDNFTSDVLGLSLSEQILAVGISQFNIEGGDNGGTLSLVDENIVHATGNLLKYVGGRVSEWNVIATDPHHVTEVTIIPEKDETNNDEKEVGPSSFRFTNEDGFFEPMLIGDNGTMLGERFRNSVYDTETNVRIGTSQGFAFNFPKSLVPSWALLQGKDSLPNIAIKNVFLDDGTIDILNYLVVGATGAYSQYVGWIYNETVVGIGPFIADVQLVEPSASVEIPMPSPTPEPTSIPGPSSDATIHSCKLFAIALSTAAAVILAYLG